MRNRRGLKRIGLLATALVIALGVMGVGYAVWTDSVYIDGTVYTGTLDADITGVSSTFVYEVEVPGAEPQIVVQYDYGNNGPTPPPGGTLISWATTTDTSTVADDVDAAYLEFAGVFPGVHFLADVEVEYLGSVPGKISFAEVIPVDPDDPLKDDDNYDIFTGLWALGESSSQTQGIWFEAELKTDEGLDWEPVDLMYLQLHFEDMVRITLHVLLPENPAYKNITLDFTGLVTITQWNEVPEP